MTPKTMDLRTELIKKINMQKILSAEETLPVVSLEDFFSGNFDCGSIGCNLPNCPGPKVFSEILTGIRENDSVQDVLVEVNEVVEDAPEQWPFSDRIYVLSSASINDVRAWLAPLRPDEVSEGWTSGIPPAAPMLNPNVKVYAAWWD